MSSWFTIDKQGILTLFFCVVKPLCEHFFDWNCCVDIGSERKIWKSLQNSFFHGKMVKNNLAAWNIPFFWKTVGIFRPFSSPSLWRMFWLKTWYEHVFFKKIRNICYILGRNARNKCFTSKYWKSNIQQISVKYLSFSHPDVSLMTNDLTLIKF